MRRVQSVAEQHDIFEMPIRVLHQHKVYPFRIVRQQRVPAEIAREHFADIARVSSSGMRRESGLLPRLRVAFDDEGAGCFVELVRMRRENSRSALTKRKRQSVK